MYKAIIRKLFGNRTIKLFIPKDKNRLGLREQF